VVVAVPLAIVIVALTGLIDFRRRRTQAKSLHDHREQAENDKIQFTERDQETLVSE
jgi:hypothetical protein